MDEIDQFINEPEPEKKVKVWINYMNIYKSKLIFNNHVRYHHS